MFFFSGRLVSSQTQTRTIHAGERERFRDPLHQEQTFRPVFPLTIDPCSPRGLLLDCLVPELVPEKLPGLCLWNVAKQCLSMRVRRACRGPFFGLGRGSGDRNSGAPITREEVYPGKNPENQFSVELFEACASKRTWAISGGGGVCWSGAPTGMDCLLLVLWRNDPQV